MLIKYRIILILVLLNISIVSQAQQTHSSPYSYIGIGDIYNSGLAGNRTLGGLGIGTRSSYYLNGLNPAGLSAMDTMSVTFEFGASGVYNILETKTLREPSYNGSIDYLALGFPITRWLKTSVGFTPFSKVGYSLNEQQTAYDDNNNELFVLDRNIKGEGGLNNLYLSNSVDLLHNFSLGLTVSYIFGQITNITADSPSSTGSGVSNYSEELKTKVSDFTYSFGLQYHDTINKGLKYTVGAIYGLESNLKTSTSALMKSYSVGHEADTLILRDNLNSSISLPSFMGFGFSIQKNSFMYGLDYKYTMWSQTSVDGAPSYLDAQSLVVGAEYIPKPRTAIKYYQRIRYRLAAKYEESYMKINNNQLKDIGITFGVGLPMKRSKSTLNLSLDMGKHATFAGDVLTQSYFRLNIDLSLHDVWFIKRKYD